MTSMYFVISRIFSVMSSTNYLGAYSKICITDVIIKLNNIYYIINMCNATI